MEGRDILKKNVTSISHLPTYMLIIGYIVFWAELYVSKTSGGMTTPVAWIAWLAVCLIIAFERKKSLGDDMKTLADDWREQSRITRVFLVGGCALCITVLAMAFLAALLPPHLIQESDALNYHITLPRQHLILHSFRHILWSSTDLFPLPLQFALAPYWFVTKLPNKLPQFFFLLGLVLVAGRLTRHFMPKKWTGALFMTFAIVGSHFVGIQMGTAMLDLVIGYCFLAFLDSFLRGNTVLAAIEFSFFVWAKSFIPFQVVMIGIIMFLLFMVLKKVRRPIIHWGFSQEMQLKEQETLRLEKFISMAVVMSVLIGGPFMAKSVYYSGTPLYPFGAGSIKIRKDVDTSTSWQAVLRAGESHVSYKNSYGYGRGFKDFIKHFWLIAVPDKGVNNKFDYPAGLPYLLFIGPFIFFFFRSIKRKVIPIIPLFIVGYWAVWWIGSQQSRFLYIPIILMYVAVIAQIKKLSVVLMGALIVALLLNALSVYRANKRDFGSKPFDVLRAKDKELVAQNKSYLGENKKGYMDLSFGDAAFAQFPVNVAEEKLPFIIAH